MDLAWCIITITWRSPATMAHHLHRHRQRLLMIWDATVPLMHIHRCLTLTTTLTTTLRTLVRRKAKPLLGRHLLRSRGAWLTPSFREGGGSLVIKCTVLKAKLKGLSGRASGGLKIGTLKCSMAGGDFFTFFFSTGFFFCILISCNLSLFCAPIYSSIYYVCWK